MAWPGSSSSPAPARVSERFGGVCCDFEERRALWISADGLVWDRVPYPESLFGSTLLDLAPAGDQWVAAGVGADGNAAIWTSAHGVEWTRVDAPQANLGAGGINDIVVTEDGITAVGWRAVGETYDGAAWRSRDTLRWVPMALDPIFSGELDTVMNRLVPVASERSVVSHRSIRPSSSR